jgi:hypothetical protein
LSAASEDTPKETKSCRPNALYLRRSSVPLLILEVIVVNIRFCPPKNGMPRRLQQVLETIPSEVALFLVLRRLVRKRRRRNTRCSKVAAAFGDDDMLIVMCDDDNAIMKSSYTHSKKK